MATNNTPNVGPWVDDRMATLTPDETLEPNVASGLTRLREAQAVGTARRQRWTWMAAAATVTAMFLAPTPIVRALAERCGEFLMRNLVGSGTSEAYVPPDKRTPMPDFTLDAASGDPVRLSAFRGNVVLLNFWKTSCGQCDHEIPWFMEFQRTYGDRLVVLGVSVDKDGWVSAKPYVQAKGINYRVMVGEGNTAQLPVGPAIPATFIIDKSGRIAVRHVGFCSRKEYEADIQTVLAEE